MIELRSPTPGEKATWLKLWHEYTKIAVDEIIDLTWERIHDASEPIYAISAYEGDTMIGFTTYIFHRSTWAREYYCYLEDLFVVEQMRGKGVGKKLVEAVRDEARLAKSDRLYLHTQQKNKIAQALYDNIATLSDFIQYRIPL